MPLQADTLHRFLFDNAPVKGELVQLPNTWRTILHAAKKARLPASGHGIIGANDCRLRTFVCQSEIRWLIHHANSR